MSWWWEKMLLLRDRGVDLYSYKLARYGLGVINGNWLLLLIGN